MVTSYLLLILVYALECAALIANRLVPAAATVLAVIWGVVLGRRFRYRVGGQTSLGVSLGFALYTALPGVSFIAVVPLAAADGWRILSVADAARFGVPMWLGLPMPFNTILGFFLGYAVGIVILKTLVTTLIVRLHLSRSATSGEYFGSSDLGSRERFSR